MSNKIIAIVAVAVVLYYLYQWYKGKYLQPKPVILPTDSLGVTIEPNIQTHYNTLQDISGLM